MFNLSSGATYEQDSDEFVPHAVRKIEETRRKCVADARKLPSPGKDYDASPRRVGTTAVARVRP